MDITVGAFLLLMFLAMGGMYIDASLGMGYGTLLTPLLLIFGFPPHAVIPSVVLSQAIGSICASLFHHRLQNVSFTWSSRHFRIVLLFGGFGIVATVLAALLSLSLPDRIVKTYVGLLVLLMGILVLRNRPFTFSWKKMIGLGVVSAFNKGFSGGGFGPVMTSGQVLSGQDHRGAVGTTVLTQVPIGIAAFITYVLGSAFASIDTPVFQTSLQTVMRQVMQQDVLRWEMVVAMVFGAVLIAPFGALTTSRIRRNRAHLALGSAILLLGLWTLAKTYWFS